MSIKKRSISLGGHATSISIEDAFWESLKEIAERKNKTIPKLVFDIDENRITQTPVPNLSSAIRLYVLKFYKEHAE